MAILFQPQMQKHCLIQPEFKRLRLGLHYGGALAALFLFVFAAIGSGRAGASRLFSEYGSSADSLAATKRAFDLNPNDPEVHYNYAVRLADAGQGDQATAEFERAASLRPADYFLWQELGRAREESGDLQGAVTALRQAIGLAPDYSQPHWLLGNLLLRNGESDSAFTEMRAAVRSDPTLFPLLNDLAWGVSAGDPQFVRDSTQPVTDTERIALARFFILHQQIEAGMNMLRTAAQISAENRRAIISELIARQEFQSAHSVWSMGFGAGEQSKLAGLFDGGFEAAISFDNQGFGWLPTQLTETVHILVDPNEPQTGTRSLRIDYAGNFDTGVPVISQLVLLAPQTHYQLSFAARTDKLVSAALPVIAVSDAKSNLILAQTVPLFAGTNGWHEFAIDFDTPATTEAVVIRIQRQSCAVQPCPIFGRAWYDSFSLKQI